MSKDSGNFEGVLSVRGSNIGNLSFEDDADFTGGIGPACANTMAKLGSIAMMVWRSEQKKSNVMTMKITDTEQEIDIKSKKVE